MVYTPYHTKAEYLSLFEQLAQAHSNLMKSEVIGQTVLGKQIKMYRIGNPNGGKVLWNGQIHGCSFFSSEILLKYAQWLLESGDPNANRALQQNCTLIIPVVNIDNIWRKNINGVDLNRNFTFDWASMTTIDNTDPYSEHYKGPSPASEPETQTLINVFKNEKPFFYVDFHNWGGPWFASANVNATQKAKNDAIAVKYQQLCQQLGIQAYPYKSWGLPAGFAVSDASALGVNGFVWELLIWNTHTCQDGMFPTLAEVDATWFPAFLPLAITFNDNAEVSPSPAGCFIATAAYGTPFAKELNVLRSFRDNFMLLTRVGKSFVASYYRISPPLAEALAKHEKLRLLIRTLLKPIVKKLKSLKSLHLKYNNGEQKNG